MLGFPAWFGSGGEGEVGEKGEGTEPHLWVSSVCGEEARGGGSTEQGGRRWTVPAEAALRRGNRGAEGSAITVGGRGSCWAGRFLRMEAGGVSSTGAGRRRPWVPRRQLAGSLGRR